jgi:hypothetical protein
MIILSVGMPRAGSGWYYNLTQDLALAAGFQDAHIIRQRFHLQDILTEVNCNIGALTTRRLLAVMMPSLLGNTFVVKAHAGPSSTALNLIRRGQIRPTYIYRDPRDAMLSAYENGQRAQKKGRSNAFTTLVDFETSLNFIMDYVLIWEAWMRCELALHVRYEDLLQHYNDETTRLIDFLHIDHNLPAVRAVVDKYRPLDSKNDQKGLHFNKGIAGRFREKVTSEQQQILADKLGPYLEKMGYEI